MRTTGVEYLETTDLSDRTKHEYNARHTKLQVLFQKKMSEICTLSIEELQNGLKDETPNQIYLAFSYILTYCKYHDIERSDVKDYLPVLKEAKQSSKPVDHLDLDENLENKLGAIDDLEARCILTLLVKYPCLRSDYCNIKIKNFEIDENYFANDTIHFSHLVKVDNAVIIQLKDEDIKLFHDFIETIEDRDYLFRLQNSSSFCKWIKKMSIKYFQKEYTISDYRKLYPSKELAKCTNIKEFVDTQKEIAKAQNHSVPVQNAHYIQPKEFTNEVIIEIGGQKIKITGSNLKITML